MKWSVKVSHLNSNLLWYESLEHQQGPRDWARYYRRSWVVQCPPPLLPEGGGRCQGEGQRRSQPDPGGARLFPVRQARPPSSRRQWNTTHVGEEEKQVWRGVCENTAQIEKKLSRKCSLCFQTVGGFDKRGRNKPYFPIFHLQLPSPFSGVRVTGLSPYELIQLWQIVIFFAMGGNSHSLKFKSILPRWQKTLIETDWNQFHPFQHPLLKPVAREREQKTLRTETEITLQAPTRAFMKIFHSMD